MAKVYATLFALSLAENPLASTDGLGRTKSPSQSSIVNVSPDRHLQLSMLNSAALALV